MRNLLEIESQILENESLKIGFKTDEINTIQKAVSKNELSKINNSRKLSKIMLQSYDYFKSEGQNILADGGVFWTAEDFGQKMFGFKKSYFMRMIKFGKLSDEKVKKFTDKCKELLSEGEKPSISVPSCLDYIKQIEQDSGEGEQTATPRQIKPTVIEVKMGVKKAKITIDPNTDLLHFKTDMTLAEAEEMVTHAQRIRDYISGDCGIDSQ